MITWINKLAMKKSLIVLLIIVSNQLLFSQENDELDQEVDEIIESLVTLDDEDLIDIIKELNKYQVILTSVDFHNKTYFLGRDLGIDQYNFTSQLMYENSNGIFAGISGTLYSEFDPKWDLTVLTAGYGKSFGKKDNLRVELGYSRYLFSDSDSNDFENSIDATLHLSTNSGTFGSSISSAYLFGDRSGFQSYISVFGDVKVFDFDVKKGKNISFHPDLSFQFASENIDTSRFDDLLSDSPFFNTIVDRITNSFETFSLRNIQLKLPLVFELNNLQIEAGYNINFPSAFEFESSVENTSFFNIGLSYIFDLK